MNPINLTLYVEGPTDKIIVGYILHAAGFAGDVRVEACGGKKKVAKRIATLRNSEERKFIALVDADELSVADSLALARQQLGSPSIPVFCAVPTIEAWLFADDVRASTAGRSEQATRTLERAPLPETIPYPKQLAFNVFPKGQPDVAYSFLKEVDISRAASRSPSLRAFLTGVADALGHRSEIATAALGKSVSRDAFSTLLRELPGATVVWKTMEGSSVRADELAQAVAEGSDVGRQYVTEVLRIARDIVARKAGR